MQELYALPLRLEKKRLEKVDNAKHFVGWIIQRYTDFMDIELSKFFIQRYADFMDIELSKVFHSKVTNS